jgi:hypothetical protein
VSRCLQLSYVSTHQSSGFLSELSKSPLSRKSAYIRLNQLKTSTVSSSFKENIGKVTPSQGNFVPISVGLSKLTVFYGKHVVWLKNGGVPSQLISGLVMLLLN